MDLAFRCFAFCQFSSNMLEYQLFVNFQSVGTGTTGSLAFNPPMVSANNTEHILSRYGMAIGNWLMVFYYYQVPSQPPAN